MWYNVCMREPHSMHFVDVPMANLADRKLKKTV